jgi:molybdate transport system substrate-binding protein
MELVKAVCRFVLVLGLWRGCPELLGAQITVFAAASLTESLRDIASGYSRTGPDRIVFSFGGSSTLARQIEEGAPADVFFSADEAQMDRLQAKGLVETRTNLLSNSLVIITAAVDGAPVHRPEDLASSTVHRVALGDPKAVPIGVYARRFLERKGLWEAVSPKVVATESVRAALAAVESGNADASIVYKTDALISSRVKTAYVVPAGEGPAIHYPAAVVKNAENEAAAQAFLRHLASPDALKIFASHGFITVHPVP